MNTKKYVSQFDSTVEYFVPQPPSEKVIDGIVFWLAYRNINCKGTANWVNSTNLRTAK